LEVANPERNELPDPDPAGAVDDALWLAELRECLKQRTGIVIQPHQGSAVRTAVSEACRRFGLADGPDLVRHLNQAGHGSELFDLIIDRITVQESYFFRDGKQMQALREEILPALIDRRQRADTRRLRIWSAGCSLGQELYTLAILLDQALPNPDAWQLHLVGTDINPVAIAAARLGHFSKWSMRSTPKDIVKRYFVDTAGDFEIAHGLRGKTRFKILNLNEDTRWDGAVDTRNMDLILCRNVFIYLEPTAVQRIVARFSRCLVSGGALMLGASDFIGEPPAQMIRRRIGTIQYLEKRPPQSTTATTQPTIRPPVQASKPGRQRRPGKTVAKARRSKPETTTPNTDARAKIDLARLADWFQAANWKALAAHHEAMLDVECKEPGAWIWCGLAQANLGHSDLAITCFERALGINSDAWLAYLGLGLVFCDADRLQEAENVLKNARYLHPDRAEAHYHLAVVRRLMRRPREARRSLSTALELAREADPQARLMHMPQTRFAELILGLEAELSTLEP